MTTKEICNGS